MPLKYECGLFAYRTTIFFKVKRVFCCKKTNKLKTEKSSTEKGLRIEKNLFCAQIHKWSGEREMLEIIYGVVSC